MSIWCRLSAEPPLVSSNSPTAVRQNANSIATLKRVRSDKHCQCVVASYGLLSHRFTAGMSDCVTLVRIRRCLFPVTPDFVKLVHGNSQCAGNPANNPVETCQSTFTSAFRHFMEVGRLVDRFLWCDQSIVAQQLRSQDLLDRISRVPHTSALNRRADFRALQSTEHTTTSRQKRESPMNGGVRVNFEQIRRRPFQKNLQHPLYDCPAVFYFKQPGLGAKIYTKTFCQIMKSLIRITVRPKNDPACGVVAAEVSEALLRSAKVVVHESEECDIIVAKAGHGISTNGHCGDYPANVRDCLRIDADGSEGRRQDQQISLNEVIWNACDCHCSTICKAIGHVNLKDAAWYLPS